MKIAIGVLLFALSFGLGAFWFQSTFDPVQMKEDAYRLAVRAHYLGCVETKSKASSECATWATDYYKEIRQ